MSFLRRCVFFGPMIFYQIIYFPTELQQHHCGIYIYIVCVEALKRWVHGLTRTLLFY